MTRMSGHGLSASPSGGDDHHGGLDHGVHDGHRDDRDVHHNANDDNPRATLYSQQAQTVTQAKFSYKILRA